MSDDMKVTGFTFIRNAVKYDYPVVEAIKSILPLCSSVVVAVGNSEDDTLSLIRSIDPHKIKIIQTTWDDNLREGGKVLTIETNKALAEVDPDSDWAFYIQGDEVMHEKYIEPLYKKMKKHRHDLRVDGLLFDYLHFYGSYDYVGDSSRWYRHEIRVIRPGKEIYSYRDAQGFRKDNKQKLRVKKANASIYHYGWVKDPRAMQQKQATFNKYWHDDEWVEKNIVSADQFDYSGIDALKKFEETHPEVMKERIAKTNWHFEHDISMNRYRFKDKLNRFLEKWTGIRLGEYKNYKLI